MGRPGLWMSPDDHALVQRLWDDTLQWLVSEVQCQEWHTRHGRDIILPLLLGDTLLVDGRYDNTKVVIVLVAIL